jgi:hypothetical protein
MLVRQLDQESNGGNGEIPSTVSAGGEIHDLGTGQRRLLAELRSAIAFDLPEWDLL